MVRLAYIDNPEKPIDLETLRAEGVLYIPIDMDNWKEELAKICQERGYKNRDEVFISTGEEVTKEDCEFTTDKQICLTSANEELLKKKLVEFYQEHLHVDEEIRFILKGQGQFDIRDKEDKWIAITVERGDLIIVPANMYHRFGLGEESTYIHAMRLFTDAPKWEAIPRVAN
ncbi:1,2-dihydroxy-3-keto-5-methylthiopentene dioxygenase [Balamuthia mandrillaris]